MGRMCSVRIGLQRLSVVGRGLPQAVLEMRETGMTKTKSTKSIHDWQFPGESDQYREARNALLEAEVGLRRQIESVAAQRRKLPLGGVGATDSVVEACG